MIDIYTEKKHSKDLSKQFMAPYDDSGSIGKGPRGDAIEVPQIGNNLHI